MKIEESIKRYNLIIGLVILFTGLLFARNVYESQNREISSLEEQIRELEKKEAILKDIQSLEKEIEGYREKFKRIDSSRLIEELTRHAGSYDIKVSSIQPGVEIVRKNFSFQPITMDVMGSYPNLRKLISILEENPQIKIEEINLSQIEEGKTKDLKATILVSLISLK